MELDEIRRELEVGANHSVLVDVALVPEFPGYVRSTYIHSGNTVRIEYEVFGMDEGGAYFNAKYISLAAAVAALETFLGRPSSSWEPSTFYPHKPAGADVAIGHRRLEAAIRAKVVPLPQDATFELQGYWKRLEE
jgi:hypothetical protein